jgi:RecB family exonuclease
VRGQILHRAAALLLPAGTGPTALAAMSQSDRKTRLTEAARRAVHAELGDAAKWLSALGEFEQQRAAQALEMLLEAESGRSGFHVCEVEKDVGLIVDAFEIRGRVDRVDSLDTGGLAVIDYKTGRSVVRPYWFEDEHADYQLPLYAVAIGDNVASMALCGLHPDGCVYRGFWPVEGSFPGRSEKLPGERTWTAQRERWGIEIDKLIRQFAAGSDLVRTDDLDMVRGPYAPLTRLAEALAACGEAKEP